MSISSLPEWKQLLLERKRREEEEREKREKEEEEKLASMPAWKRGIIQRRKAKQEGSGEKDREKDRDSFLLTVDSKSTFDGLSDTDSSITVQLGSETSHSSDPGLWLDAETKSQSQVSMETIVPVHENPFIRTQSGWRRGVREAEKAAEVSYQERGNEQEAEVERDKEREKDKTSPRDYDGEAGRGRDMEMKIERLRDRSEGRERETTRDKCDGREKELTRERSEARERETARDRSNGGESETVRDRSERRERETTRDMSEVGMRERSRGRELVKDAVRERECLTVKREEEREEDRDCDPQSPLLAPRVPGLRTIRADNIIIIEQDRKGSDEKRSRWREVDRERLEEDHQGEKRGVKMDLREILASGGSVTEIQASEVLIIKPSARPEERGGGGAKGSGREDGDKEREIKCTRDGGREPRIDTSWLRDKEKEMFKEKEKPWGQATVIKDDRRDSCDDSVFVEKGGRVSQLLSKFGEHPKPPSRSKSSDNFIRPAWRKDSGDQEDDGPRERKADVDYTLLRGVPKRSYSFSERVVCVKENGLAENQPHERKAVERALSDRRVTPWMDAAEGKCSVKESMPKIKLGLIRPTGKDCLEKHKDGNGRIDWRPEVHTDRQPMLDSNTRKDTALLAMEKIEPLDKKRAAEMAEDTGRDVGFTVACVKSTEGISFAKRVPIRQDGRARAMEKEMKLLRGEKEREGGIERGRDGGGQVEAEVCEKRGFDLSIGEAMESTAPAEATQQNYSATASLDPASPSHKDDSHYRHASAFKACSNLLCTVADNCSDSHKGTEWSGIGPQGPYLTQSVLSKHTEDLISKIERVGETALYTSERGERVYRGACEIYKESTHAHDAHIYSNTCLENLSHDVIPRPQKRIMSTGIPPGPLEIQIPRTVFYVAEEAVERKRLSSQSNVGQQDEEGLRGVERRDSWRIGKPLSRVESLREKIRQRERERAACMEIGVEDGGLSDGVEAAGSQRAGDRCEDKGEEMEREKDASAHIRKRLAEAESKQEGLMAQTPNAAFDVTQEVSASKNSSQLPLSLPFSQAVGGEEAASVSAAAFSDNISDSFQISEDNADPLKRVEELSSNRGWQRELDREEEDLSEKEECTSPPSPLESLSPSPPPHNSLADMSRIYNLKAVGSRTDLHMRVRTAGMPTVHLVKVRPHTSHTQQEPCNQEKADVRQLWGRGEQGDNQVTPAEDTSGVQEIQQQVEQFQLKGQEVVKLSQDGCTPPRGKDLETKEQQSPGKGALHQAMKSDLKGDQQTSLSNSTETPGWVCSPTSHLKQTQPNKPRTVNITPRTARSQSPDSFLKPVGGAPTPASSPSSLSPAHSPSVSPSPTSSPIPTSILSAIRIASRGQGKRGATITINPKKSTGAGATSTKTPAQQTKSSSAVAGAEPVKKRYPTVEEIEVIGGYQNLDKSCLIKNRGTPKLVKVCFDEVQLEQVCEYPSESSMLACTPYPHDLGRDERVQEEEVQEEEEEEERGAIMSKSTRSVGTATGPGLRMGLQKHNV